MRPILPLIIFTSLTATSPAIDVGGLSFAEGNSWKPKPTPRKMSQGGLTISPGGESAPLDADFFYFGSGQGGSVEANIARWQGQFKAGAESTKTEIEIPGLKGKKATLIIIKGTFLSGPPFGGPKTPIPNHAMLGAIVPGQEAPIFIKITGPEASVITIKEAFHTLVSSAAPQNKSKPPQ